MKNKKIQTTMEGAPIETKMSGIKVNESCKAEYKKLKAGHVDSYIIFRISDSKEEVEVESVGDQGKTFDDLKHTLPQNDCRYAVLDFSYSEEGAKRSKIVFIFWTPPGAPLKHKAMYASTSKRLCQALEAHEFPEAQVTSPDDLNEENLKDRCKHHQRHI
eukprot:CAMPEP_0174267388 /NCGR_PEP_ID=MMETSP0439-20130205/33450_1 /TAXON_ID=0 /ORGANISM="Stereomyxa ramosa, Strain Chinc5" /LENGTH=159 /DNA_ID=CAMNT_0015354851 /DNA_START=16 /DNA_END=495 /DNA_ORIENTATION=+